MYADMNRAYEIEYAENKGKQKKALEIAKKMKGLGIGMDLIVKSTGLTEEEIEKLK